MDRVIWSDIVGYLLSVLEMVCGVFGLVVEIGRVGELGLRMAVD